MKKKNKKLRLNRETIRFLDSGLERAAGGVTGQCDTENICTSTPDCYSTKCGSGGTGNCNHSQDCETGGACFDTQYTGCYCGP